MPWISFWQKPVSQKQLKSFGWLMAAALFAASVALFYAEQNTFIYFLLGSIVFLFAARFTPQILKPAWLLWMAFAQILGTITTALLLSLVFIFGINLISVVYRLVSKKRLAWHIGRNQPSYWILRKPDLNKKERMEMQF